MNGRDLMRAAVVAALLALGVGLFFACFERTTVEGEPRYSRQARENPYLAAGRLLEAMGHPVVALEGPGSLAELPPPGATLLLTTRRRTLSPQRTAALRRWVEAGGHLIVETFDLWDDPERREDPLLDPLELRSYHHEVSEDREGEEEEASGAPAPAADDEGEEAPGTSFAAFPDRPEPLELQFDPRYYWLDPDQGVVLRAGGDSGVHLVTLALGAGLITALTDSHFLENPRIGQDDHAELLVRLARMGGRQGPVWIVISERWPGLLRQLASHALPVVASGGALLLLWLWRAASRFGPVLPMPAAERRRWMEHLEAAGRYHWRCDRGRVLLEASRASLERALSRAHPGWVALPALRRHARIAAASGLSEDEVAAALSLGGGTGEADFADTIRSIERIRRSL